MSKVFLIKGHHKILKIQEIAQKAHAITNEGTFKIRENTHSNTFIIYPSCSPIVKIYELSPLNYLEIYNSLPFSTFLDIIWTETPLTQDELDIFKTKYFVLTKYQSIAKISYNEIVKILKYMQSLETLNDFNLYENIEDWQNIKSWIITSFSNISLDLGFFILLDCLEKNMLENFILEWKKSDLFETDIKKFLVYLENTFLDKKEKSKVKEFLIKFCESK